MRTSNLIETVSTCAFSDASNSSVVSTWQVTNQCSSSDYSRRSLMVSVCLTNAYEYGETDAFRMHQNLALNQYSR